jgi:hypothetical protein
MPLEFSDEDLRIESSLSQLGERVHQIVRKDGSESRIRLHRCIKDNSILEGLDSDYGYAFIRSVYKNYEVAIGHTFEGVPDGPFVSYERNGMVERGIYRDGELVKQVPDLEF